VYEGIFGYKKYDIATGMLFALGLPSCDTMLHSVARESYITVYISKRVPMLHGGLSQYVG